MFDARPPIHPLLEWVSQRQGCFRNDIEKCWSYWFQKSEWPCTYIGDMTDRFQFVLHANECEPLGIAVQPAGVDSLYRACLRALDCFFNFKNVVSDVVILQDYPAVFTLAYLTASPDDKKQYNLFYAKPAVHKSKPRSPDGNRVDRSSWGKLFVNLLRESNHGKPCFQFHSSGLSWSSWQPDAKSFAEALPPPPAPVRRRRSS